MTTETYRIVNHVGDRIGCEPVFLGHCSATFDATDTTTACEGGLFTDPEGNDLVAVCILGRWLDLRHVVTAMAWTNQHGRDLPDGVMERIQADSTIVRQASPVRVPWADERRLDETG